MKSKFRKAVLLGVIATFLLTSSLYASHSYDDKGEGERCARGERGEKFEKLKEELGITPEQATELKEQRKEFSGKRKELRKKLREKKQGLKAELEKESINRAAVDNTIEDIKNLTGEQYKNRVDKIISMKSILTPEQFKKLQSKMREKRETHSRSGKRKQGSHGFGKGE